MDLCTTPTTLVHVGMFRMRGYTQSDPYATVLLSSASVGFTTDLYPVLSGAKIYPCFADILVPSKVQLDCSSEERLLSP